VKQLGEVVSHHGGARTRGSHDLFAAFEDLQEVTRGRACLVAVAGVERRLPAAGLLFRKVHLVADPFQHLGHRHADVREKLIHHAGNE
jgi:class 3 adenylate cyclase